MWWTAWLTGKMPSLPTTPSNYYLLSAPTARIKYGVDHTTYMHTLAADFGGSPSLSELWRTHGAFVTLVYCFSAAFTSHYRLVGPFKSPKAPEVVKTEIWETVTRRGLLGNLYVTFSRTPAPSASWPCVLAQSNRRLSSLRSHTGKVCQRLRS